MIKHDTRTMLHFPVPNPDYDSAKPGGRAAKRNPNP